MGRPSSPTSAVARHVMIGIGAIVVGVAAGAASYFICEELLFWWLAYPILGATAAVVFWLRVGWFGAIGALVVGVVSTLAIALFGAGLPWWLPYLLVGSIAAIGVYARR